MVLQEEKRSILSIKHVIKVIQSSLSLETCDEPSHE